MKRQITVTDLTRMQGDRVCLFGVDADGKGMRPDLPPTGIREGYLLDGRGQRVIRPFAVVEFDFVRSQPKPPHTEDWEINPTYAPRLIRHLSEDESRMLLEKILDESIRSIFGAEIHNNQYVNEGEGDRSLGTVRANEVFSVRCFQREGNKHDYRTKFSDATREIYDLPITDLALREYCEQQRLQGRAIDVVVSELRRKLRQSHIFVRVGLARPFAKMRNRCYLQVCAIHAFPGYAEHPGSIGAFGGSGDMDCRNAVFTVLNDSRGSNRARAAYLLGETRNPLFLGVLCKATRDRDGNVRRLSASALGKIKDAGALESLTNLLADAKPQVRQYAIKALGDIGNVRAVSYLRGVEEDPIPYVRRAVTAAIAKIQRSVA